MRDLLAWMDRPHDAIDPVVAAAMSHYQFEALHPFHDGNGRIGRLLIVLGLQRSGLLSEPTLTVSGWFEGRRDDYYERLFDVSARGAWDDWTVFFARGMAASATATLAQLGRLVRVQDELKERVRASRLRSSTAIDLVDLAVSRLVFGVADAQRHLDVGYGRANTLIADLVGLSVLAPATRRARNRVFFAPRVVDAVLGPNTHRGSPD